MELVDGGDKSRLAPPADDDKTRMEQRFGGGKSQMELVPALDSLRCNSIEVCRRVSVSMTEYGDRGSLDVKLQLELHTAPVRVALPRRFL